VPAHSFANTLGNVYDYALVCSNRNGSRPTLLVCVQDGHLVRAGWDNKLLLPPELVIEFVAVSDEEIRCFAVQQNGIVVSPFNSQRPEAPNPRSPASGATLCPANRQRMLNKGVAKKTHFPHYIYNFRLF
jgi:hypothetical protein